MFINICFQKEEHIAEIHKYIETKLKVDSKIKIDSSRSLDALLFKMEDEPNIYDLIILDTTIGEEDGLKIAKTLREEGYKNDFIFISEDEEKVFNSFQVETIGYVLFDDYKDKLIEAIERAYQRFQDRKSEILSLQYNSEVRNIRISDIRYFESSLRSVIVYYGEDQVFTFNDTLDHLEELLFNKGFVRIRRNLIVSTRYIKSARLQSVTLTTGEELPVGRVQYKNAIKELKKTLIIEADHDKR